MIKEEHCKNMTEWNKEQSKVIESRKLLGQILVSAAAGSGKTAVLVERIIMSLLDTVDGEYVNDIDDFLVVTFTRAAAAQMKDKITKEIGRYLDEESAKEHPDVKKMEHLMRQQIAVGRADICTLDSFSAKVVRENFNVINIDPGFSTVEGNMMKLVKDDILDDMFDSLFTGNDGKYVKAADFSLLARVFFTKTDDEELKKLFYKITSVADTMPEPTVWLEESRVKSSADVAGEIGDVGDAEGKTLAEREKRFNSLLWVEKLMDYIRGRMSSVLAINEKASFTPNVRHYVASDVAGVSMAANELGLYVLSSMQVSMAPDNVEIRKLDTDVGRDLGMIIKSLKNTTPALKEFIKAAKEAAVDYTASIADVQYIGE